MLVKPFYYLLLWGGLFFLVVAKAEDVHIVDHVDLITVDSALNLPDLIHQTLEKYPDYALIAAMHQESDALNERGSRWISGAPQAIAYYKDDAIGTDSGSYEFDGTVQVPVWNWGQRDAGLQLAEHAQQNTFNKLNSIKLKVAGLVRKTLWALKLESLRYEVAKKDFYITDKLVKTVKRRVELGDLPKADFLLAQSEMLQKKTELIGQEAEVMHARKRFSSLTEDNKMPAHFNEIQSKEQSINEAHPALAEINAIIALKKAEVTWIKAQRSGQTTLAIGGVTERGARGDIAVDSIAFNVSVPFGGNAFIAPQVAAANREYVAAEADKKHLQRALLEQLHEAEHALEVERETLKIVKQMQANAEEQLKMAQISFDAGEINLMVFLKIQARSQRAIKNAQESEIRLQRDIALYNQAVGVMP